MKPVIGITCDYDWETGSVKLYSGYYNAIVKAGGLPFVIPCIGGGYAQDIVTRIDGLLITGGQDVDPAIFGEQPHPMLGRVNPCRDEIEIALCKEAAKRDIPVFGICRGCQLMNIAAGGDIYQDVPSQTDKDKLICHSQSAPKWFGIHEITIVEGTLLSRIIGTDGCRVNSFHHQAARRAGRSLRAAAYAPDGIIEALEAQDKRFFLGVQWHPEHMYEKDERMFMLFKAFVNAACNTGRQG